MPGFHVRRSWVLLFTLTALAMALGGAVVASASSSSPLYAPSESPSAQATREPGMMFDPTDRLAPPPMSDPPTQVEQGQHVYYLSCMVCHGDRGQGLTEEWRGALDPADQNCWQSKCHAANHPPEGFELPRYAPAIIGAGRLAHYQTAAGLYEYIRSRMPWQAPGILSDEAYWQLTAYLVEANGISLEGAMLGPRDAARVRLDRRGDHAPPEVDRGGPTALLPAAVVALLLAGAALARRRLPIA